MAESKSRLLYILQYLWLKTDAEHYATTGDILTYLRENDIRCDRKTIPGIFRSSVTLALTLRRSVAGKIAIL